MKKKNIYVSIITISILIGTGSMIFSVAGNNDSLSENKVVFSSDSETTNSQPNKENIFSQWGAVLNNQYEHIKDEAQNSEKSSIDHKNLEQFSTFSDGDSQLSAGDSFSDEEVSDNLFTDDEIESNTSIDDGEQAATAQGEIDENELQRAICFYQLRGDENPEQLALEYVTKQEALYLEAIENGFDVSDEEIWNYLSDLRSVLEIADNSDDIQDIISSFPSEDDYWNFEFTVYKKQLPIKKYLEDIGQKFVDEIGLEPSDPSFNEAWIIKLDDIKQKASEKYFPNFGDGN